MPAEGRPFATLRVTAWPSVILSQAKNLSQRNEDLGADMDRMPRVCLEQGEGCVAGARRQYSLKLGD
jgi:hypothetical protein